MLSFFESLELRRLLSGAGEVDQVFGLNGTTVGSALLPFATEYSQIEPVAVLPAAAGRTIVISLAARPDPAVYDPVASRIVVARFNANGTLDTTFGERGYVVAGFGTKYAGGADAALDSQGRIVVGAVGEVLQSDPTANSGGLAALRITPGGVIDSSFGTNGHVVLPFGRFDMELGAQVAIGSGDRVLLAATRTDTANLTPTVVIARLRSNGKIDTTFDGDGKRTMPMRGLGAVQALAIDAGNRVLLAGQQRNERELLVSRLTTAGKLDVTFDGDGKLTLDVSGRQAPQHVSDIDALPDGRIVLDGDMEIGTAAVRSTGFLMRLRGDGTRDPKFAGGDGLVTAAELFGATTSARTFGELFPVATGEIYFTDAKAGEMSIIKVRSNGKADMLFGDHGLQALPSAFKHDSIIARRGDSSFAVAREGIADPVTSTRVYAGVQTARLTPMALPDPTYLPGAFVAMREVGVPHLGGTNLVVDATGQLVAAGLTGTSTFTTVRIAADGTLDATYGGGGFGVAGYDKGIAMGGYAATPTSGGEIICRADGWDGADGDGIAVLMQRMRADGYADTNWGDPYGSGYASSDETSNGNVNVVANGWTSASWDELWGTQKRRVVLLNPAGAKRFDYYSPDPYDDPAMGGAMFRPDTAMPIGATANGGFYVVGRAYIPDAESTPATQVLRRLLPNGQLDTRFDVDGTKLNFTGIPFAAQDDGGLLYTDSVNGGLYRLNPNGTPDLTFGIAGVGAAGYTRFTIDAAGHLIGSRQFTTGVADGDIQVIRLTQTGRIDITFGGGDGIAVVDTHMASAGAEPAVLVTAGNDILVSSVRRGDLGRISWSVTKLVG